MSKHASGLTASACLLFVDVVDSVDPDSAITWKGVDLSAFETLVFLKLDGRIVFIKGDNTLWLSH